MNGLAATGHDRPVMAVTCLNDRYSARKLMSSLRQAGKKGMVGVAGMTN
jgi:hypothetical protein